MAGVNGGLQSYLAQEQQQEQQSLAEYEKSLNENIAIQKNQNLARLGLMGFGLLSQKGLSSKDKMMALLSVGMGNIFTNQNLNKQAEMMLAERKLKLSKDNPYKKIMIDVMKHKIKSDYDSEKESEQNEKYYDGMLSNANLVRKDGEFFVKDPDKIIDTSDWESYTNLSGLVKRVAAKAGGAFGYITGTDSELNEELDKINKIKKTLRALLYQAARIDISSKTLSENDSILIQSVDSILNFKTPGELKNALVEIKNKASDALKDAKFAIDRGISDSKTNERVMAAGKLYEYAKSIEAGINKNKLNDDTVESIRSVAND